MASATKADQANTGDATLESPSGYNRPFKALYCLSNLQ
jgi:hypothetical protein